MWKFDNDVVLDTHNSQKFRIAEAKRDPAGINVSYKRIGCEPL
jgi:hypothetical protein